MLGAGPSTRPLAVATTGVQWRDLPTLYAQWKTAHERHRRWSADGTWELLLQRVQAEAEADASVTSTATSP
ncbi:transposase [Streptomyces sp. NPDC048516]|uniref:transposase n=1 Tax=Streptomyces sp. NPDC048516 TaxID=3365565 RepID=UPI00371CB822